MAKKTGSFTIASGSTVTDTYTLGDGNTGIVAPNGTLSTSTGNPSVTFGNGTTSLTNSGTISSTGDRALYANTLASGSNITITNNAGGKILDSTTASNNDAFKIKNDFTGGSVTINNSGYIVAGTVDSNGNIVLGSGTTTTGQALDLDDVVSSLVIINNYAGGVIGAADSDAIRPGGDAIINNYGTIISQNASANSSGNDAIDIHTPITGSITINNYAGGNITGARHAITGMMGITVDNAGTITGQLGSGINLDNAPGENGVTTATATNTVITNEVTGIIQGNGGTNGDGTAQDGDGVDVDYTVTLNNYGHIYATGAAVGTGDKAGSVQEAVTVGGGTINNYSTGVIQSVQRAITVDNSDDSNAYAATTIYNEGDIRGVDNAADGYIGGISITGSFADTLTNKGSIEGSIALGGGDDTFNAYTGSTTTGTIDGGDGTDTANLLGTGTGTLANVVNFEVLDVQGGTWTLTNVNFSSSTAITGGSTLEVNGTNSLGAITIGNGTLDVLGSSAAGSGTIQFADGAASTLSIASGVSLTNTISGFSDNDTLDFAGFDAASTKVSFNNTTDVLTVTDSQGHSQSLQFSGDYTGYEFHAAASSDGIAITESSVACYGLGTLIETDEGDVTVESLAIGDKVRTMSGALRSIKWIGRRAYAGRFIAMNRDILPVCFKAGSLGENLPRRDLLISPHHAMYIDGLLIEAKDLVNGVSIVQAATVERVDYFHIELDSHDVIIAEGALSETFIDDESRAMFHNAMDYRALYPNEAPVEPLYCAPRIDEGEALEAIRATIEARFKVAEAA